MKVFDILEARGFVKQVTDRAALCETLNEGHLSFYVGIDPTADSMHVGHLLPVMAMAWLQRAGHQPILVMGGGTAMIGDPSGKTELRKMITVEQIEQNAVGLKRQLERLLILDGKQGLFVNNADWLGGLNYITFLREIGRYFSVNRMLAMEAYKQRLERGLSFIEFNYQLLQAYDFLELFRRYGCTLQMGGDDQWGNILAGTDLIRRLERAEVEGLTLPLITTSTGAKMGKTAKGAVWLDPARFSAFDYYQYWLNVSDSDVDRFLKLYTFLSLDQIAELALLKGADIREAKRVLAYEATVIVHGQEQADRAAEGAKAMVSVSASADLPTHCVDSASIGDGVRLYVLLTDSKMTKSRGEARRLLKGGGVRVNGEKVSDVELDLVLADFIEGASLIRVGKKRAIRFVLQK